MAGFACIDISDKFTIITVLYILQSWNPTTEQNILPQLKMNQLDKKAPG